MTLPDIDLGWIESEGDGGQIRPGLAWDVDRALAYVVEGNTIAVVDLATGEAAIATASAASLPDRLFDWLAPAALAKTSTGVSYNARLSPDGARLYVSGVRTEPIYDAEGFLAGAVADAARPGRPAASRSGGRCSRS